MERYDYQEAVENDVRDYIEENIDFNEYSDREELEDYLNDRLWAEDSVTGNASGSYYCNAWKAEESICHNLDLLGEALDAFDENTESLRKGAEYADVTIRCYLLGGAISRVLDEYADKWEE